MKTQRNGYQAQVKLFKVLSHPVRLRIVDILARQEACVCHLSDVLNKRQPYISQQLAVLREAEVVADRKDGQMVYYRLKDGAAPQLLSLTKEALIEQGVHFPPVPEPISETCSCPKCQN